MNNSIFSILRWFQFFSAPFQISIARSTLPMSALPYPPRITFRKFMAIYAMRFCRSLTSTQIFAYRNWFEMIRINAISYSAQMVQMQTFRNSIFNIFKRNAMRQQMFSITTKLTVPIAQGAYPQPTSFCFSNFRPKFIVHTYLYTGLDSWCQI